MSLIQLITSIDIESKSVVEKIQSKITDCRFMYITSTLNIKEIREDSLKKELIPYSRKNSSNFNLITFGEFQKQITKDIYMKEKFIPVADQKFMLSRMISEVFSKEPLIAKVFEEMKHELFELFKFLMFYEVEVLDVGILNLIEEDFSYIEKSIFKLYNDFSLLITDVIPQLELYKDKDDYLGKLAKNIFKNLDIKDRLDTFQDKLKLRIKNEISKVDKIFIDGFLFFNDLQKYVIKTAVSQGKQVIIVAKYSISDNTNSFLLEDNYIRLAEELGQTIDLPYIEDEVDFSSEKALNYIQMKYPEIDKRISTDIQRKFSDSSVNIINPFSNRDDELKYIVRQISNRVKERGIADPKKIIDIVNSEFAIVLAVEKEKYEERFSQIFEEIGVFLLNEKLPEDLLKIDPLTLPSIYYSKEEYLKSTILDCEGNELSFDQKYMIFRKLYQPIQIFRKPRPIVSYPIGQYILQIYNMATEGISIESFKMLLYSNWQYVSNHGKEKADIEKWDRYICEFKNIETYFENTRKLTEWIEIIKEIYDRKQDIKGKDIYKWHPYNHIAEESIVFIFYMLEDLEKIIKSIKDIDGGIDDHINELKGKVIQSEKILEIDDSKLSFEQKIIRKLDEAVREIGSNSLVKDLNINYFAENLQGMLQDWEEERLEEEEISGLKINIVNLENMKKYKYVFFMMLEANKYPRKYDETFPFSSEILEILQSSKYGIMTKPSQIHGLDYHLRLEQYLFKNVLEFTTEELVITYTEKENGNNNKPSIFIEDITSMFDLDVEKVYKPNDLSNNDTYEFDSNKINPILLNKKNSYSSVDLGTFLLCPRMYFQLNYENQSNHITYTSRFQLKFYAEAILYRCLMDDFKYYNRKNNKYYSVHENEYYYTLKAILDKVTEELKVYFPFLTEYEVKDIRNGAFKKALNFIKSNVINYHKYNNFTILKSSSKEISLNESSLTVDNDTEILGDEGKKYYQTGMHLEFLVLSTGREKTDWNNRDSKPYINEIIKALKEKNEDIDKIKFMLSFVQSTNLGIQYERTNYEVICKDIIEEIAKTDFYKAEMMPSKFCIYCKIVEVCKGYLHISKEVNDVL